MNIFMYHHIVKCWQSGTINSHISVSSQQCICTTVGAILMQMRLTMELPGEQACNLHMDKRESHHDYFVSTAT